MDRYLLQELSCFFLFIVSLLTSLGVAIGTVSDLAYKITEYQLPIPVAILIFCYKIPEYAAYALPISLLLSSLTFYSRLNSDRELIALLSFGISLQRILISTLIFSLLITSLTFLLNELIVPAANYQANLQQTPFIPRTELNLQKQDIFYTEFQSSQNQNVAKKLKNIYFAARYEQPRLLDVTIISFKQDHIQQIITAQSAQWNQQQQLWHLVSGAIRRFDIERETNLIEEFTSQQISFPDTLFEIIDQERSPEEMNIRQAKKYLNLIKDSANPIDVAKFRVRIQQKYAFPFICLIFALIGSALGAKYGQLNRAKSFGLGVGIVFIYYCLGFAIGSLGITGVISPFWSAWLPNLIGLITGGYLLANVNH